MSANASFVDLMHRVRAGDESASTELVRQYEPAIRRSMRLRFDPHLQPICDSMDICQAVMCSFFVRARGGQYALDTPEDLLRLLATMARHKLSKTRRDQQRARRDNRRQVNGVDVQQQVAAPGPSPSQQLEAEELVAVICGRLSAEERQLMELRDQGWDWNAIAAEMGGNPEALRKKLARALSRVAESVDVEY